MHQLPVALQLHLLKGQVLIGDAGRFASRSIFFIVLFAGSGVCAASISVIPQLIYQTSD